MMKGLELPINMIVVVAIAVLVLVVVAAFFAGWIGKGTGDVNLESAFGSGCNTLRTVYNCNYLEFDVNYQKPGSPLTRTRFSEICRLKELSTAISNAPGTCVKACGCNVP